MTQSLTLDLGAASYEILIGNGVLPELGARLRPILKPGKAAVVTNQTVAPLYLDITLQSLRQAGYNPLPIILPDGEIYKDNATLQLIYDALISNCFERSHGLIALGGGVIGDMTGFAAATFLRGVPYIQVPTTLLAQVDSSVGGKTGINHPLGKNLIGAFYQPKLVLIDTATLATLPHRQLLAGMAEVIKYGIIASASFFHFLEENLEAIIALDEAALVKTIKTCCTIKADVVKEDERETGKRAMLNLGHTFGHAIETLTGYTTLLHGEAVAIGMIMAADLSQRLFLCDNNTAKCIHHLIQRTGLPTQCPNYPGQSYLEAMARDKKVSDGQINFVLVGDMGQALLQRAAPAAEIKATIQTCMENIPEKQ